MTMNEPPSRLLVCAEAQGFGPSANAVHLLHRLNIDPTRADYIGSGTSYEYFRSLRLRTLPVPALLSEAMALLSGYDCLLSVMNSPLAILAKKAGLRVIYADLIFWLYDPQAPYSAYREEADRLLRAAPEAELQALLAPRSRVYDQAYLEEREKRSILAHIAADLSLVEEFVPSGESLRTFLRPNSHTRWAPPVLDCALDRVLAAAREQAFLRPDTDSDGTLAVLGGMSDQNRYSRLMNEVLGGMPGVEIYGSASLPGSVTLPPELYFRKLAEHRVVVAQPGFATLCEMLRLGLTPVVLPAQNAGQLRYVHFMKSYLGAEPFLEWEHWIPRPSYYDDWSYMKRVEAEMENSRTLASDMRAVIRERIARLRGDGPERDAALRRQERFVRERLGQAPTPDLAAELRALIGEAAAPAGRAWPEPS